MPTPHYGQPRYRAIADELRRRIEGGTIPPGALLPTESALTSEFKASRGTVRQAIALLREADVVATEHGRGTYVKTRRNEHESNREAQPETRHRQIPANPELAALFAVDVGTALVEQQSVTRIDGAVGIVVRTYRLLRTR
ncbi:GntR family transcriptional regulator [Micromonospora carbonacea]|uniref:GntR family transcriptional regulator n=1 Tax=Micromonospora carbonacea TaxID=47853 RepID=UPI00159F09C2|nr:GntR family transcriptional regulator [Micromonospora carbonacea]